MRSKLKVLSTCRRAVYHIISPSSICAHKSFQVSVSLISSHTVRRAKSHITCKMLQFISVTCLQRPLIQPPFCTYHNPKNKRNQPHLSSQREL